MTTTSAWTRRPILLFTIVGLAIGVAIALVIAWPEVQRPPAVEVTDDHEGHDHDHADHGHEHGDGAKASIELSDAALKNIGYKPFEVKSGSFKRSIPLPGIVVERPGRSQIHITAPLTGKILKIVPIEGAAIEPASPMFEIGLTHEDLVAAQTDFFRTAESLDLVNREIARLRGLGEGMIAGQRIVEQDYERQKLEAKLAADKQALLLHGLSDPQVEEIRKTRQLLSSLVIQSPAHRDESSACGDDHSFHIQQMVVKPGEQVNAGQLLCVLADHCELMIEGSAFEDDAAALRQTAVEGRLVSATLLSGPDDGRKLEGLKLLYLADHVDPDTRTLKFYLSLPNKVVFDRRDEGGHRFIAWKFTPGQRMTLHVPVEQWENRFVLPVDAVVEEGAESYVYRRESGRFEPVEVHVSYRDQQSAVVASDGLLRPGDIIAGRGAYQIHLAIKNQAGGGVDPHAGHNH